MEHVFSETARYYDKLYAKKDYSGEVERLISLLDLQADSNHLRFLMSLAVPVVISRGSGQTV